VNAVEIPQGRLGHADVRSIIIGAVPRMGKTFLLRLLLLIDALDGRSEIHAYDLKGTGDLAPARSVAHAYGVGDEPEDMARMIDDFRGLRREMRRRTKVIRDIAEVDELRCPENKITDELANDKSLGLHPIVIAVDECQIAFEHPRTGCTLTRAAAELIISYGAFLDRGELSRYITAFIMTGDPVASSRTRWPRGRARTAVTSRFSAYARRGPALGPVSLGTGTIATAAPDSRISAPG
jgi:hypothetical protein